MDIADVNELRTKGGMTLLENLASYSTDSDFLSTYYGLKDEFLNADSSAPDTWYNYYDEMSTEGIRQDKEAEQRAWQAFVNAQRENKRLLEEMLIARRMRELERIATGNGRVLTKIPYFKGVSAAEILTTIM